MSIQTGRMYAVVPLSAVPGSNAGSGARVSSVFPWAQGCPATVCLNAPYGARCFLTKLRKPRRGRKRTPVLMHLMALGAF